MKTLLLILVFLPLSALAQVNSFEVLNPEVEQGDTIIVRINPQWQGPGMGIFVFGDNYLPDKYGYVFVGVGVDTRPGNYLVNLSEFNHIRIDQYPQQIEIKGKKFAEWFRGKAPVLSKAVKERLTKDREIKERVYNSADNFNNYTTGNYVYPLDVIDIRDEFGSLRVYGTYDKKKKETRIDRKISHGGVDLRAQTPTEVKAINSGKVLMARHLLADGNILIIDHGSGVLSLYLHLSKFKIKEGDNITKGQVVALTGATGTAALGSHLHFMIKIHKVNVDPLKFVDIMNQQLVP